MKFISNITLKIFSTMLFISVVLASQAKANLKIGSDAPVASAKNHEGVVVNLSEVYKANKYVLVYFYPKADTPGCTAQACSLRDAYTLLKKEGVVIYGVSSDGIKTQKEFKDKYKLPFDLIADEKKSFIKAFGVSTLAGFASRQAFLVRDGKLVWLDREASTKEQADDILKYLEQNKEGK